MKKIQFLVLITSLLSVETVTAKPFVVSITGTWGADDFTVTETSNPNYDPANPEFDGKVFGVAPSAGSATIQLLVNTDSAESFSAGYMYEHRGREYTLAHDWYGYSDVTMINDPYTFGTATWENSGILTRLEGPSTATLWTDCDVAAHAPSRLSFRMFGTGDGLSADMFFGSRTPSTIGSQFLLWEYYDGEEIRSHSYSASVKPLDKPPQNVVLDWDTPANVKFLEIPEVGGYIAVPGTTPPADASYLDEDYKNSVLTTLRQIFSGPDANLTNIFFSDTPTGASDETVVYFANVGPEELIGEGHLAGQAYTGVDQFNTDLHGEAIVFLNYRSAENTASVVAHEMGHLLGLRHVDPEQDEIMEPTVNYDAESFNNVVSDITDIVSPFMEHNPVYHLRRYVDGISHEDLVAEDVRPGNWDLGRRAPITTSLSDMAASETTLYGLYVLTGESEDTLTLLGYFDSITLGELANEQFELGQDSFIRIVAASVDGGDIDVVLSAGNAGELSNQLIQPLEGELTASFQTYSETAPEGYTTLTEVTIVTEVVPEPSTLILLCMGAIGLLAYTRRRWH